MADTVQTAIYKLRVEGAEQMERAAASVDKLTVADEKLTRATRTTEDGLQRLLARLDPAIKAQREYERVLEQVARYREEGRGVESDLSRAVELATRRYQEQIAAIERLDAASDKFGGAARLTRYELLNLGRQAQDIAVSLASGQSPFTVLAQQGTQVLDVLATSGVGVRTAFGQIRETITSLLTPTRLMLGLGGGLAFVGYQAYKSWRDFAYTIDDLSRVAGTSSREMARLQAAASFKGIGQEEFTAAMQRFAEQVYLAQRGVGGLADVLRVNGVAARDFMTTFDKVADLIRNATSYQQRLVLLQQMGLPATMEFVRFISQGAEGLRRAREQAVEFGGAANQELVEKARKFDEVWNQITTNIGMRWKSLFVDLYSGFDRLVDYGRRLAMTLGVRPEAYLKQAMSPRALQSESNLARNPALVQEFYDAVGFPKDGGGTKDPQDIRRELGRERERINILGQLATVEQQVRAQEIAITLARLDHVRVTERESEALMRLARFQAEEARLSRQVQYGIFDPSRQMANARLEIQTLVDQGIIRSVQDYGAALEVVTKRLKEASDAAAIARSPFEQLTRFALDGQNVVKQLDSFGVSALGNIENALVDMVSGATSAKEAFSRMAEAILADLARMIIRMQVTVPLAQALNSALGAGGLLGFLGLGGAAAANTAAAPLDLSQFMSYSAAGNVFDHGRLMPFAYGGVFTNSIVDRPTVFPMANGAGLMGESGPEAVMPLIRDSSGRLGVSASGGGNVYVTVNNAPPDTTAAVTTQRRPDGSLDINVTLEKTVVTTIQRDLAQGGTITKSFAQRFGLNPAAGLA